MATGRILTIGHGSHSWDAFSEQLSRSQIQYVIDVRSTPYSRFQPEFSRDAIERSLREGEIKYVFMGDLLGGRPNDEDCYTNGKVDYTKIRTKDFFCSGITRLKNAYQKGLSICLFCSEGHPSQCHRAKLVAAALVEEGIDVTHILPDGSRRSQAEVIDELTDGQHTLFGDHFVSRKAYR